MCPPRVLLHLEGLPYYTRGTTSSRANVEAEMSTMSKDASATRCAYGDMSARYLQRHHFIVCPPSILEGLATNFVPGGVLSPACYTAVHTNVFPGPPTDDLGDPSLKPE